MNLRNALHGEPGQLGRAHEESPPSLRPQRAGVSSVSPGTILHAPSLGDPRRIPLTVAAIMLIGGILWVFVTDELLYRFVHDPVTSGRLETAKGWVFVAVAAAGAYVTTSLCFARLSRSEATLRATLRSIADGVLLVGGPDRAVMDANEAAARILGARGTRELVGMDVEAFARRFRLSTLDGHRIPPERYASQRALDGENVPPYSAEVHGAGDAVRLVSVTVAPVRVRPDGPVELAISVIRDITDSANLERERDRFLGAAAHALKTPLAGIKANSQLLLRSARASNEELRCAQAIDRQSSRMDLLVQNLLVLSRLRSGTLALHMRELDLAAIVRRAAEEHGDRNHSAVRYEATGSWPILGDDERLLLVVRNVLETLTRTSPPGAVVTVRITEAERSARVHFTTTERRDRDGFSFAEEASVARHVGERIVRAHGGRSALEPLATALWFEVPSSVGTDDAAKARAARSAGSTEGAENAGGGGAVDGPNE